MHDTRTNPDLDYLFLAVMRCDDARMWKICLFCVDVCVHVDVHACLPFPGSNIRNLEVENVFDLVLAAAEETGAMTGVQGYLCLAFMETMVQNGMAVAVIRRPATVPF